jgi:hypothetical protein
VLGIRLGIKVRDRLRLKGRVRVGFKDKVRDKRVRDIG